MNNANNVSFTAETELHLCRSADELLDVFGEQLPTFVGSTESTSDLCVSRIIVQEQKCLYISCAGGSQILLKNVAW